MIGAAPTARTARELRDVAGISAATLHALFAQLDRRGGLPSGTVLLLDEAAMAPTRLCARLFARAEQAQVKIVAVGDAGQLPSVQAGEWLAALSRHEPGPQLRQVLRQQDPAERDALAAPHDGDAETYLAHKASAITIHATQTDAIAAVVEQWAEHAADAVMIARENATREQLNHAARERLKADKLLPERGLELGGRQWAVGDRVIARRNHRRFDVDNGTIATITALTPDQQQVTIRTAAGEQRTVDLRYLQDHVEHAYAITAHSSQGATVQQAIVVGRSEDFTREWAYTALSRARGQTAIHIVSD